MATETSNKKPVHTSEEEILLKPLTLTAKKYQMNNINLTTFMQAYNFWMNIPDEKFDKIRNLWEMTNYACYMLDDLYDESATVHSVCGIPSTINSANYAMMGGLSKSLELDHSEASRIYIEQMLEFHRGQASVIYWRDNNVCPTEDEYRKMSIHKKGSLIRLSVELMQLFSDNKSDFTELNKILGEFFQIYEDYLNFCSKDSWSKNYLEVGTFSFPVIHAIQTQANDKQITNILRKKKKDDNIRQYLVSLLEKYGSLEHTRKALISLRDVAEQELKKFERNPYLLRLIDNIIFNLKDL